MDIAPETLYAEATGGSLPDWMDSEEDETANQRLHQAPQTAPRFPGR